MVRKVEVVKSSLFDAAHRNIGFGEGHKCNNIHGHTFYYDVHVVSEINEATGLAVDFGVIKEAMKSKVDNVLDHKFLNEDVEHFKKVPPSAENIAYFILNQVQDFLEIEFIKGRITKSNVSKVVLHETPTSAVIAKSKWNNH